MSHRCVSVQWKPPMFQTGFSMYCLMMESKYPPAYSHLSAEAEKQNMGILWVHPQSKRNKIDPTQHSCFFLFRAGSRKSNILYILQYIYYICITAMELSNTIEAPILKCKCIVPTLAMKIESISSFSYFASVNLGRMWLSFCGSILPSVIPR